MVANNTIELVQTEDGSLSCCDQETGELYHNRAGAFTEALKNYVEPSAGLATLQATGRLAVLDVCFGLGYNTWVLLSALSSSTIKDARVKVVALEKDPHILPLSARALQYAALSPVLAAVNRPLEFGVLRFNLPAGIHVELDVRNVDLRQTVGSIAEDFDVVFHDPFSPRRCPELWTVDLFNHYRRLLQGRAGRVLTYSAASAVRGGLNEAGFAVWRTEAVGGKSGGTLAILGAFEPRLESAFSLSEAELARLRSRSGIPYRDPQLALPGAEILRRREDELRRQLPLQMS